MRIVLTDIPHPNPLPFGMGEGEEVLRVITAFFFFLAPRRGERTEVRGTHLFVAAVYDRRILVLPVFARVRDRRYKRSQINVTRRSASLH